MLRRRFKRESGKKPIAAIDMNSLIDLTFLLLVTFIITLPALEKGIPVNLPKASAERLPDKKEKPHTITVDAMGTMYFDSKKLERGIDEVEEIVKSLVKENPDIPVLVRGDEMQNYGSIMKIVKLLYRHHVHRLALVTLED